MCTTCLTICMGNFRCICSLLCCVYIPSYLQTNPYHITFIDDLRANLSLCIGLSAILPWRLGSQAYLGRPFLGHFQLQQKGPSLLPLQNFYCPLSIYTPDFKPLLGSKYLKYCTVVTSGLTGPRITKAFTGLISCVAMPVDGLLKGLLDFIRRLLNGSALSQQSVVGYLCNYCSQLIYILGPIPLKSIYILKIRYPLDK